MEAWTAHSIPELHPIGRYKWQRIKRIKMEAWKGFVSACQAEGRAAVGLLTHVGGLWLVTIHIYLATGLVRKKLCQSSTDCRPANNRVSELL